MATEGLLHEPLLGGNTASTPPPPTTTTTTTNDSNLMGNKATSRARLEAHEDTTSEDELMAGLAACVGGEEKTAPTRAQGGGRRHGDASDDSMSRMDPESDEDGGPSYWAQAKAGYAEAINAIIRPPRARYSLAELGPERFTLAGLRYHRIDFVVRNNRNMLVQCSWWQPVDEERVDEKLPCVIYMHGNSSCRGEAIEMLPLVLDQGCTLVTFDFCGCGKSDGDFISLGWYERDDCAAVVEHMRATNTVSTIGLWGRSMGAATALMHGHRDNGIAAMVLDSSFASLEKLVYALYESAGDQLKYVPKFTVAIALRIVRSTILKVSILLMMNVLCWWNSSGIGGDGSGSVCLLLLFLLSLYFFSLWSVLFLSKYFLRSLIFLIFSPPYFFFSPYFFKEMRF